MKKWQTLNCETVYKADPYVEVIKERVAVRPDLVIDDFYQIYLRSFVCCVPFLENGNVLMLRQYKHGLRDVTLTFPGGFIEEDEAAMDACARELVEETGFQARHHVSLGEFIDNGNQRGCAGTFFIANHCEKIGAPNSGDLEEMNILELQPWEVDMAILDGKIGITHHAFAWLLAKQWDRSVYSLPFLGRRGVR